MQIEVPDKLDVVLAKMDNLLQRWRDEAQSHAAEVKVKEKHC